jgi:hypothetical protein
VPLVRPRLYFEPDQVLYQVPRLTARAALGFGAVF